MPNISTPTSQVWRFFQGLLEDRVVLEAQVRIGGAELSNVFGLQLQQLWVQPAASVETWSSGQLDNQDLGPTDGRPGSRFALYMTKKYLGSVLDVGKIPSES